MERESRTEVERLSRRLNPTLIALLGGLGVLLIVIAYFANNRNPNQDKLSDTEIAQTNEQAPSAEKRCSSKATYDLIKHELFRRAAQSRGADQSVYDQIEAYAVVRMENPVLENEDSTSGALNCSGSLSIDLPPGVAVAGGRRTLTADVDYTIDASGNVTVANADAIVAPLATLARVEQQMVAQPQANEVAPETPETNVVGTPSATAPARPTTSYPGRPSFDCSRAQSRGEIAVCSDASLSALDVSMATEYRRALGVSTPVQHALLQQTRNRFLAYRDDCPTRQCIADAYVARMREIRDIMEGRWQPR